MRFRGSWLQGSKLNSGFGVSSRSFSSGLGLQRVLGFGLIRVSNFGLRTQFRWGGLWRIECARGLWVQRLVF